MGILLCMNRGSPPKKVPSGAREEETKMIKVKIWQVNTEMASQICEMQNKKNKTQFNTKNNR